MIYLTNLCLHAAVIEFLIENGGGKSDWADMLCAGRNNSSSPPLKTQDVLVSPVLWIPPTRGCIGSIWGGLCHQGPA